MTPEPRLNAYIVTLSDPAKMLYLDMIGTASRLSISEYPNRAAVAKLLDRDDLLDEILASGLVVEQENGSLVFAGYMGLAMENRYPDGCPR